MCSKKKTQDYKVFIGENNKHTYIDFINRKVEFYSKNGKWIEIRSFNEIIKTYSYIKRYKLKRFFKNLKICYNISVGNKILTQKEK